MKSRKRNALYYRKDMSTIIRMKKLEMGPFIDNLSHEKQNFQVRATGYSKSIEYDNGGNPVKRMIIDRNNFQVLGAYAKVKAAVLRSKKKMPRFDPPAYYEMGGTVRNIGSSKPVYDKVLNIDIKSAYATCLFNHRFIDEATLDYLENEILENMTNRFIDSYGKKALDKIAKIKLKNRAKLIRLKSIGMLATRTLVVDYKKGKWKKTTLEENKYLRSVFMFAQYETGRIMKKIAKAYGRDFLFFWVDGIYVRKNAGAGKAEKILRDAGYRWHNNVLNNFKIWREVTKGISEDNSLGLRPRPGGKELIHIEFEKDGEIKPFAIPTGKIARNW